MNDFHLRCRNCNKVLVETYCAFREHCPGSLLVTEFDDKKFKDSGGDSIWRFNWLPVRKAENHVPGPFNGYWPEIGANVETCTFKEYEAAVVLQNAMENNISGLVVASTGNTARAFAHLSVRNGFPVIIIVPKMCLQEMWYLQSESPVPTLVLEDGDYADAIDVAKRIALASGMPFEGGIKNIAKRDGLGVVMLDGVSKIGEIPAHYVQAVGSGAGAVAAWEMPERFKLDGRFGDTVPRLHLGQNLPFAPMFKAWTRGERTLDKADLNPDLITQVSTKVLSNRYPAYDVQGGVYDALTASNGNMYGITNEELFAAKKLFESTEKMDIVPAAAVSVGSLKQAVDNGAIKSDETVLLNITGGGEERIQNEGRAYNVKGIMISKNIEESEIDMLICKTLKPN